MNRPEDVRRRAVITGACGGVGRAMSRSFGERFDLVLTDIAADSLETFTRELRDGGYTVSASVPGDFGAPDVLARLAKEASSRFGVLLHTAAVAPAGADWDRVMVTNLVATERLLDCFDVVIQPGCVAIVISSNAGYFAEVDDELRGILADPLHPDLLKRLEPHVRRLAVSDKAMDLSSTSYTLSKWRVTESCAERAPAWTRRGARLVTISPGVIYTPMGRAELASNPRAAEFMDAIPAGRWATPMDIVATARFLASEDASFISGCDLRVDGATVPALRSMLQHGGSGDGGR